MSLDGKTDILRRNLKLLMAAKGITGAELAKKVGVSAATFSRLMTGQLTSPRIGLIKTLADFFEIRPEFLETPGALDSIGTRESRVTEWIPLIHNSAVVMKQYVTGKLELDESQLKQWLPPIPDAGLREKLAQEDDAMRLEIFAIEAPDDALAPRLQRGDFLYALTPQEYPKDKMFTGLLNLNGGISCVAREVRSELDVWYFRATSPEHPNAGKWIEFSHDKLQAMIVGVYKKL